MRLGLVTNQTSHISGFLAQGHGLEFHQKRGRLCSHRARNVLWLVMVRTQSYKLFDTSTLKTLIKRSVQLEDEPIRDFELALEQISTQIGPPKEN